MFNRLKAFIDKHEIPHISLYGFLDKHSTKHVMLDIVNSIQRNMNNKLFSCCIFINLQKVFDTRKTIKAWLFPYFTQKLGGVVDLPRLKPHKLKTFSD